MLRLLIIFSLFVSFIGIGCNEPVVPLQKSFEMERLGNLAHGVFLEELVRMRENRSESDVPKVLSEIDKVEGIDLVRITSGKIASVNTIDREEIWSILKDGSQTKLAIRGSVRKKGVEIMLVWPDLEKGPNLRNDLR